jgi:hypothetical protein
MTEAMSLMRKPTKPTAPIPSRLIFMESQSSSLPGFVASLIILAAWVSHDRMPMIIAQEIPALHNKRYCTFLQSCSLLLGKEYSSLI